MITFFWGVLVALSSVVALFFLRFWKRVHDGFFLLFSLGFWALALNWIALAFMSPPRGTEHYTYVIRLIAFTLIIAAIVVKNRESDRS
jgi:hypothetical protein